MDNPVAALDRYKDHAQLPGKSKDSIFLYFHCISVEWDRQILYLFYFDYKF